MSTNATQYVLGRGSQLAVSTDGTTWTPIGQASTASFSGGKADMEDITNFASPSAYREYAPTLLDAGQCQVKCVFDPKDAGQLELASLFNAQTLAQFKLTLVPMAGMTQSFVRTFSAYVSEQNLDVQFDKSVSLSCTLKITGPISDSAPTS